MKVRVIIIYHSDFIKDSFQLLFHIKYTKERIHFHYYVIFDCILMVYKYKYTTTCKVRLEF